MNKPRLRKCHGQAVVEFALIAGLIVMLAIGTLQGLLAIYYYHALEYAADAGARAAAIEGGNKEPEVGNAIEFSLRGSWVTLPYTYTVTPERANVNQPIIVTVQYQSPVRLLFWDLRLSPHQKSRYSEKDWNW